MYKILRSILFLFPTEWIHYFSMNCLRLLCSISFLRKLFATIFSPSTNENLKSEILNLKFKNPVGLGAGFDAGAAGLLEQQRHAVGEADDAGGVVGGKLAAERDPRLNLKRPASVNVRLARAGGIKLRLHAPFSAFPGARQTALGPPARGRYTPVARNCREFRRP